MAYAEGQYKIDKFKDTKRDRKTIGSYDQQSFELGQEEGKSSVEKSVGCGSIDSFGGKNSGLDFDL